MDKLIKFILSSIVLIFFSILSSQAQTTVTSKPPITKKSNSNFYPTQTQSFNPNCRSFPSPQCYSQTDYYYPKYYAKHNYYRRIYQYYQCYDQPYKICYFFTCYGHPPYTKCSWQPI